ncbi:MAG: rRNA maturation RNase YbeY [Hyphomonadaceae bacterium]
MSIETLIADARWDAALGGDAGAFAARALEAAAQAEGAKGVVTLLLTDDAEMQRLNLEHRGLDKATNVLSFPTTPEAEAHGLLGDIAAGYDICAAEAQAQGKSFAAHAAHLFVHGFLHLLGYDHEISESEAARMETRERAILAALGVADPYVLPAQ